MTDKNLQSEIEKIIENLKKLRRKKGYSLEKAFMSITARLMMRSMG